MSKKDKFPYFLYDLRSALVAFPAMFVYCGFLPLLKICGAISISWWWALAPVWIPFFGFWAIVGFCAFVTVVTEIGFILMPDTDIFEGKKLK